MYCSSIVTRLLVVFVVRGKTGEQNDANACRVCEKLLHPNRHLWRFVNAMRVRHLRAGIHTVDVVTLFRRRLKLIRRDFSRADVNERTGGQAFEDERGDGRRGTDGNANGDPNRRHHGKRKHYGANIPERRHARLVKGEADGKRRGRLVGHDRDGHGGDVRL